MCTKFRPVANAIYAYSAYDENEYVEKNETNYTPFNMFKFNSIQQIVGGRGKVFELTTIFHKWEFDKGCVICDECSLLLETRPS